MWRSSLLHPQCIAVKAVAHSHLTVLRESVLFSEGQKERDSACYMSVFLYEAMCVVYFLNGVESTLMLFKHWSEQYLRMPSLENGIDVQKHESGFKMPFFFYFTVLYFVRSLHLDA